jgi:PAS domain S-box-containing protein
MAFVLDITERKQAEDELREKEVQYRNLADSGLALIWRAGTDKLCTYFNEPWLKFTGRTLAQEWGNGWTEGVHPEDLDRCVGIFVTAFDKRETFDMEYRLKHASGEYRWIRDLGTPNFSSSGEFVGYIGHCFDITVQKQAEEKIRKFNEDLEQKVEERTARLQESIVQLEELNRVFVGRELKMAELKARISQLEGKT